MDTQSVFKRAELGESPKSTEKKIENTMVDILGEVEEDTGEKIITKIVSKTNKEGLEKLSTIEDEDDQSKEKDNDSNETKSISS